MFTTCIKYLYYFTVIHKLIGQTFLVDDNCEQTTIYYFKSTSLFTSINRWLSNVNNYKLYSLNVNNLLETLKNSHLQSIKM